MSGTAPVAPVQVSVGNTVMGLLSFILIGVAQGLYGPALPGFTEAFDLPDGAAGFIISMHSGGALLGILSAIPLAGRTFERWRVGTSTALLTLGALLIGVAPSWPLAMLGALLVGFGYGALTIGMNSLFASGFGKRSPFMVNLLNAIFGLGAVIGPVLVALNAQRPHVAFLILALAGALIVPAGFRVDDRVPAPVSPGHKPASNLGLLLAFVLLLALAGGVEGSTVGYAATYLVALGVTPARAAALTSLFFLTFTLARLTAIPLSLRLSPAQLTLGGLGLTSLLLLVAQRDALAPAALVALGGAVAVIFPNAFTWLNRAVGTTSWTALAVAGALLGGVLVPAVVAWVAATFGEAYIMSVISVFSFLALLAGGILFVKLHPK